MAPAEYQMGANPSDGPTPKWPSDALSHIHTLELPPVRFCRMAAGISKATKTLTFLDRLLTVPPVPTALTVMVYSLTPGIPYLYVKVPEGTI
ncbi:MAG: hypothetical protein EBZ67_08550 [Chitinophagia bacterium]|nr:hypothetical protein [Chitinophagia bacterium]